MNRFLAILLCLCLSCQCVLKLSIYAWFELNQEYIAATLCENKSRPELVCCGKCVLSKRLNSADGTDRNNPKHPAPKHDKTEITSFVLPGSAIVTPIASVAAVTPKNGTAACLNEQIREHRIFHPPGV